MSDSKPISSVVRTPKGCLLIFFALIVIAGVAEFCFLFLPAAYHVVVARSWTSVPCKIISSKLVLKADSNRKSSNYNIEIRYRYEFAGASYESNRYQFLSGSGFRDYGAQLAVVKRLRHGTWTTCFVNPDHPNEAVIERGWTRNMWPVLITSLAFISAGVFFTVSFVGAVGRIPPVIALQNEISRRELVLKPKTGPFAGFGIAIQMAVFWNGIVSVFVYQFLRGVPRDWGSGIFLIPFFCIGLGLMVWAVVRFLTLFDPQRQLRLANGFLTPGTTTELRWEFTGRYDRISRLKMSLQGREEATHQAGKSTITVTNKFVDSELFDSSRALDIRKGKAKLVIPAGTMHSFRAASNRIIWSIQLKAEIAGLPNLKEEFPLIVSPVSVTSGRVFA